ncbi:MAG: hypothetical protein ACREC5_06170, partial [Thermoplasmata archaeon]
MLEFAFAPIGEPPAAPSLGPAVAAPGPLPLAHRLDEPTDFSGIFAVVRSAVRRVLSRERPGLGLALSNLPPQLGAYWQLTGNLI